ncbi:MAG: hypothetical protein CK427_13070 [Leptospira sp.]|nr:MAG: hypothetical protein CK427_13070 [Leptospira sp.]
MKVLKLRGNMSIINRSTIILFHKKPLIEWQNSIFPEDTMEYEEDFFQNDQAHVYLIPEFDFEENVDTWLKENYIHIFEDVLEDWCTNEALWPKNLTYAMFKDWFHINYQSMVLDTLDEPIIKDDDDDFFEDEED